MSNLSKVRAVTIRIGLHEVFKAFLKGFPIGAIIIRIIAKCTT